MQPKNSKTQPPAQHHRDQFDLERRHRGALGAYTIARILRDNHSYGDERDLKGRDEYGLLLALEFLCFEFYAPSRSRAGTRHGRCAMSSPVWSDLLVDVEQAFPSTYKPIAKLTADQVQSLKTVASTADYFATNIGHGLAAVGELLAHAAHHKELTDELAVSAGWLVRSLALLSMTMAEAGAAATYKLEHIPLKGGEQ